MRKPVIGIFFSDDEMVFYKNVDDLADKITRISQNEKLRKKLQVTAGANI